MDVGVLHRMHSVLKQETTTSKRLARPWVPLEKLQQIGDGEKDSMLESMVTNAGSLDLDDEGKWDFHGHSSGRVFLRKMREQFGDLMGQSEGQHAMPFLRDSSNSLSIESPRTAAESSTDPNLPNTHELPPKSSARTLCENALGKRLFEAILPASSRDWCATGFRSSLLS